MDQAPPSPSPRVSVIMRTKNSDWVVAQALQALHSQTFRDFELLVVDSGSTDRTLEIVAQFPARLVRIEARDYYPGLVLNDAIARTAGELVVFVNSDSVCLSPHSLARLVAAFDEPDVMAAFGRQLPRPEADDWVRRDYACSFPERGAAPAWLPLSLPLAGLRRSAWEQQRFYTEAWGSEDSEWGWRARRRGWRVAYVPGAIVMHSHNYTLRQLYGRRFIEGEADAFIYGRHSGWWGAAAGAAADALRDAAWSLRRGHLGQALLAAPRRAVGHWAYLQGHRLGTRRRLAGNHDASVGQLAVLSRYEA